MVKSIDIGPLPCAGKVGKENSVNYPPGVEYLLERKRKLIGLIISITKLIRLFRLREFGAEIIKQGSNLFSSFAISIYV